MPVLSALLSGLFSLSAFAISPGVFWLSVHCCCRRYQVPTQGTYAAETYCVPVLETGSLEIRLLTRLVASECCEGRVCSWLRFMACSWLSSPCFHVVFLVCVCLCPHFPFL